MISHPTWTQGRKIYVKIAFEFVFSQDIFPFEGEIPNKPMGVLKSHKNLKIGNTKCYISNLETGHLQTDENTKDSPFGGNVIL